jgi:von Willebrand factor type A domain
VLRLSPEVVMTTLKLSLGLVTVGILLGACSGSKPPHPNGENDNGAVGQLGGADGTPAEFQSCATQSSAADAKPVFLVFMFDKSGSMVTNGSPKWASATAASKAFFESPNSKGLSASLSFFPDQDNSCGAGAYATPNVAMTSLPSANFGASLDGQAPNGDTPTHVALQGAIAYAQTVAANEGKDGKVAIVLVTDGMPNSVCDGNSVAAVRSLAEKVKDTVPTYVIGVGGELASLREIAVGGGTNDAFIVNTDHPAQIQQDFLAAINAIKASALACDYEIPAPPAGEELDREKVNVVYQAGGTSDTLIYNPSCDGGSGWRYDDTNAPKRILLCDASCAAVKAKPGEMEVLFGCVTRSGVVK